MLRHTLMAIAAVGLLTANVSSPAFAGGKSHANWIPPVRVLPPGTHKPTSSSGVGTVKPIGSSYTLGSSNPTRQMPTGNSTVKGVKLPPGQGQRGCTGAACNGGNAGILWGDGGSGAHAAPRRSIGKPKYEDMKVNTGAGQRAPATGPRGGGFFQIREEGG